MTLLSDFRTDNPGLRADRRLLVKVCAALSIFTAGLTVGHLFSGGGMSIAGTPREVSGPARVAVVPSVDDVLLAQFRSFALNAFLATLMDERVPAHWTDVGLDMACGPKTRVEVDGRPMVPGDPVPASAFTVRWTMDQCWPLEGAFDASGVIDLFVFHQGSRLNAVVSAARLKIHGVTDRRLDEPFTAALSLATRVGER